MSGKEAGIGFVSLIAGAVIGGFGYQTWFASDATVDQPETPGARTNSEPGTDLAAENEKLRSQLAAMRSELDREKLVAEKEKPKQDEVAEAAMATAANMGVSFDDRLFYTLTSQQLITPLIGVAFVALLCGLWPATRAARLNAIQAISGRR